MNTIDEMNIEVHTVYASEYLASENGKKALALFQKHLDEIGKKPAKEFGFHYAVANELYYALTERLPFSRYNDFAIKDGVMEANPEDVVYNWIGWERSDYAGNILGNDDDEYFTEVEAAFGKWCPNND